MQLDGNIAQFPLRELIEMIVYSSVTGVLELRVADDVGQLFFRDGRPYHATVGGQTGLDAIVSMFEVHQAPFRFVADSEMAHETLWQDPLELIEYGEEQARLWSTIRPLIPSLECVPVLRNAAPSTHVRIDELDWQVLSAIDGRRSVSEISGALNFVVLDTCLALKRLLEQGLVALQQPRAATGSPRSTLASSPQADRPTEGSNFLERLMTNLPAIDDSDVPDQATQIKTRSDRYVVDR